MPDCDGRHVLSFANRRGPRTAVQCSKSVSQSINQSINRPTRPIDSPILFMLYTDKRGLHFCGGEDRGSGRIDMYGLEECRRIDMCNYSCLDVSSGVLQESNCRVTGAMYCAGGHRSNRYYGGTTAVLSWCCRKQLRRCCCQSDAASLWSPVTQQPDSSIHYGTSSTRHSKPAFPNVTQTPKRMHPTSLRPLMSSPSG